MKASALVLVYLAAGCVPVPVKDQAWEDVPATSQGQATAQHGERLAVGDTVRVHTKEGKTHIFRIYKIEEAAFYGIATNSKSYRVGYGALTSIEVKREEDAVAWVAVPIPTGLSGVGPNISMGSAGGLEIETLALLFAVLAWRRRATPNQRLQRTGLALRARPAAEARRWTTEKSL